MILPEYRCSQPSLYATCRIMWGNYAEFQAQFAAFKPKYTAQFGVDALEDVDAAQMLPDDQARGSASEKAKLNLEKTYGPDALLKWQMLKSYIEDSFEEELAKPELEAAGWGYYEDARRNNWDKMSQLMASGAGYLAKPENVTALTANDIMPPTFVGLFGASRAALNAEIGVFKGKQSAKKVGTASKIAANNAIYKTAIRLSKDSPLVFPTDAETAGMMVFAEMLRLVDGGNPAPGFSKVYPVAAGENLTVNDFVLTETMELGITLMTDGAGPVFACRNLLAGCAGTGTLLLYNVQENTGMEKLSGDNAQLVFSNTGAVDVEVLVKVLTG